MVYNTVTQAIWIPILYLDPIPICLAGAPYYYVNVYNEAHLVPDYKYSLDYEC